MTNSVDLSEDAVTVVALSGTALAYAATLDEEVERWIRTLRLYGEAGVALSTLGIDDEQPALAGADPSGSPADADARVASVLTAAEEFAVQRGSARVGTVDLLFAVLRVYGPVADRALVARGTDRVELVERLEPASPAVQSG